MNPSPVLSKRAAKADRAYVPSLPPIPVPELKDFCVTTRPMDVPNDLNRLVQIERSKIQSGMEIVQYRDKLFKQTGRLIDLNARILKNPETRFTKLLEKIGIPSRYSRLMEARQIVSENRKVTTSIISRNMSALEFHDINKNVILERLNNACVVPAPTKPTEILQRFCSAATLSGDPSLTAEDFSKMSSAMLQRLHRTLEKGIDSGCVVLLVKDSAAVGGFSLADKNEASALLQRTILKMSAVALRREGIQECLEDLSEQRNVSVRKALFILSELGDSLYGNLAPEIMVRCLREKAISVFFKSAREIVGPNVPTKIIYTAVKVALRKIAAEAREKAVSREEIAQRTTPHNFVDNIADVVQAIEQKRMLTDQEYKTIMNCVLQKQGMPKATWSTLTPLGITFVSELTSRAATAGLSLTLEVGEKKLYLNYIALARLLNQNKRISPQKAAEPVPHLAAA